MQSGTGSVPPHMWAGCRVLALRASAICIAPPATCARNFSVAIAAADRRGNQFRVRHWQ